MKILAIETSCDETAIAILEAEGSEERATFRILGNALLSQIDIHKEYGGVFPALAKRAHAENLVPLLDAALSEAELLKESTQVLSDEVRAEIGTILEREPGLTDLFLSFISECEVPNIDAIAITAGPGLEPALWVGVNFAKALALVWNKPLIAVDHMEGHMLAALATSSDDTLVIENVQLPVLGLLISGGHTELDVMDSWLSYRKLGATRDDAAGEAFDKVARMLGLPYPGGPAVSKLAREAREAGPSTISFPRPMLSDPHMDFSFSGLKTAVLYHLKKKDEWTDGEKREVAREFEDAVADVLYVKTLRALEASDAQTLVLGGGVSGNTHIQATFQERFKNDAPQVELRIPSRDLTTDNAVMIGIAGFYHALKGTYTDPAALRANGNLSLA